MLACERSTLFAREQRRNLPSFTAWIPAVFLLLATDDGTPVSPKERVHHEPARRSCLAQHDVRSP